MLDLELTCLLDIENFPIIFQAGCFKMIWFSAALLPQEPGIDLSHKWPKEVSAFRGCCTGWSPLHVIPKEGRWVVNITVWFLPWELIELILACIRPKRYKVGPSSACVKFCQSWAGVRMELSVPNCGPLNNYSPFFLTWTIAFFQDDAFGKDLVVSALRDFTLWLISFELYHFETLSSRQTVALREISSTHRTEFSSFEFVGKGEPI